MTMVSNEQVANQRCSEGGPRAHASQIVSISSHFVLWEAVSQTKYCCSSKIKHFGPQKNFGLATPLSQTNRSQMNVVSN